MQYVLTVVVVKVRVGGQSNEPGCSNHRAAACVVQIDATTTQQLLVLLHLVCQAQTVTLQIVELVLSLQSNLCCTHFHYKLSTTVCCVYVLKFTTTWSCNHTMHTPVILCCCTHVVMQNDATTMQLLCLAIGYCFETARLHTHIRPTVTSNVPIWSFGP